MDKIKFSRSFEDFVTQTKDESKVSKLLYYYIREQHPAVMRNFTAEKINYLTFRKDGTISYLPHGRELKLTDSGEWSREGRQDGKPAKTITNIMRKAVVNALNSRDLEIFSNLYKGRATDMYTIKEARGQEIADVYRLEIPFSSCMNGGSHSRKLRLYTENPDAVGLLYVQTGDTCQARALIWTDDKGNKIVDRVYGSEEFRTMFRDYAREIGAYKKSYDGAGESTFLDPSGDTIYKTFRINLENDADEYPYVDTFCYLSDDDGIYLSNEQDDAIKKLQCTGGGYEDLVGVEVYGRRGMYPEADTRWSNYHDANIYEDDAIYIEDAGDWYYMPDGSTEDAIQIGRRKYVLIEDCEEVEVFNADEHDGLVEMDDVCTFTCYKLPDGSLIPKDDAEEVTVFVIDGEIQGRD